MDVITPEIRKRISAIVTRNDPTTPAFIIARGSLFLIDDLLAEPDSQAIHRAKCIAEATRESIRWVSDHRIAEDSDFLDLHALCEIFQGISEALPE